MEAGGQALNALREHHEDELTAFAVSKNCSLAHISRLALLVCLQDSWVSQALESVWDLMQQLGSLLALLLHVGRFGTVCTPTAFVAV